ncbi:MAG: cbb3-type cytochrome c oxidase subunit I [Nitrospinota bacterium]
MRATFTGRWFALSIISLGIGGSFAFLIGMSRMPFASKFLPENYFKHALVGHVDLAILCWLMLSAVVLWSYYFKTPTTDSLEISFPFAIAGVAMVAFSALFGIGEPVLNNYVPTIVHPLFFIGLALFFAAFSMNVFRYLGQAYKGIPSDDMTVNALSIGVFVSVVMIIAVGVSLALIGVKGEGMHQQAFYERLFWTPGHIQQILNGAMLVAVWHALLKISTPGEIKLWGFLKGANKWLVVSALVLLGMSFVFDPLHPYSRIGAEIVYALGLGIPLFLHIANIFLRMKFDYKSPASVALLFSMLIYLFGVFIAYAGFHNDTRVPAHYHGAVTALTLGLMGFAYHMMVGYKMRISMPGVAKFQPYLYGVGMFMFIMGLFISGIFGAPRKTFGVDWTDNPAVLASLTLMGVGTLLAVIGGALFVLYAGLTLVRERKLESGL